MRLLAYITPNDDAAAVRDALRAVPGVTAVAMRSGRHWRLGDLPERGYDRVCAPAYPGILASYAAAGVPAIDAPAAVEPWCPDELTSLPASAAATIVAHGKYAREELAAAGVVGAVIAVNHSGHLLDAPPDYLVANDGIIGPVIGAPARVRCIRRAFLPTLPTGPWYALDRLGITTGLFTIRCALRLAAQALSARRIRLIGHDCLPGAGALSGSWGTAHIASCKRETAADLRALVASGIAIEHVGWDVKRATTTLATYEA